MDLVMFPLWLASRVPVNVQESTTLYKMSVKSCCYEWISLLTHCSSLFVQNRDIFVPLCPYAGRVWWEGNLLSFPSSDTPLQLAALLESDRNNWCDWHPLGLLLWILMRVHTYHPWALNSIEIVPLEYTRISVLDTHSKSTAKNKSDSFNF